MRSQLPFKFIFILLIITIDDYPNVLNKDKTFCISSCSTESSLL